MTPRTTDTQPLTLPSDQDATGRSLGDEELAELRAVIGSGTLTSTKGASVQNLQRRFAERPASATVAPAAAVRRPSTLRSPPSIQSPATRS